MKNKLLVLCFASIFFFSCKNNNNYASGADKERKEETAYNSYGAEFNTSKYLTAAEMEELLRDMKPGDTVETVLQATVISVCKNKGCWMTLHLPEESPLLVKFKDYGFFVPKDIEQKDVLVKGKAYITEVSIDEQRHYAEDKGESAESIAAITESKRTLSFLADGVIIKQ